VPKKGIKPLKSTVALLVSALGALKAALKAAVKGVIGKKALPKAGTTPFEQLTGKINKR